MKTMMMTVIAGVVMTVSGMAEDVTATIPFGFGANGATLESGPYRLVRINTLSGVPTFTMRNSASQRSVLVMAQGVARPTQKQPYLTFLCSAKSECWLSEMWTGGAMGYRFAAPKLRGDSKLEARTVEFKR